MPGQTETRFPDFFIVGAPKCGTTSLARYLGAHPKIFMSPVKEPKYFFLDAPELRVIDDLEAYQRLFARAEPDQLWGEASTAYLYSDAAVPAILAANPAAKIIAMVRNPVEMVVSYHNLKVNHFEEHERDFAVAWQLSRERARGRSTDPRCHSSKYLDYQWIGRLGEQVTRLKASVAEDQLHIIVFDDLCADPQGTYRATCHFLGVAPDERSAFPIANPRTDHRWSGLARFLRRNQRLKLAMRGAFPRLTKMVGRPLRRLNARPLDRQALPQVLREEMIAAFQDDIRLLGELLHRDLSHWYQS
jgi:Sulfotransferase domain